MKTRNDPRHQRREHLIQLLFEWGFRKDISIPEELAPIVEKISEIDKLIEISATQWPLAQIAPVDLAILRHGVWELLYAENKPSEKVVLDESIELAKEYGGENSPSFINGVLGSVFKNSQESGEKKE
jgi:N utilization substance protein B